MVPLLVSPMVVGMIVIFIVLEAGIAVAVQLAVGDSILGFEL